MAGTMRECLVCGRAFLSPRGRRCCSSPCIFWSLVDRSGGPDACWIWKGHITPNNGYGDVPGNCNDGKRESAHRVAWKLHNCCDPGRLYVLHRCDVRACVNPNHLFLGTQRTNIWDAWRKGRITVAAPGEGHPKAKLTESIVKELRARFAADSADIEELAERYGVTPKTIQAARRGRTWKHLPQPDSC